MGRSLNHILLRIVGLGLLCEMAGGIGRFRCKRAGEFVKMNRKYAYAG